MKAIEKDELDEDFWPSSTHTRKRFKKQEVIAHAKIKPIHISNINSDEMLDMTGIFTIARAFEESPDGPR
jgi:hypothetical protein